MIIHDLHLCTTGTVLLLALLLQTNVPIGSQKNTEVFINAIEERDVRRAYAVLARGVDLNAQDSSGRTALTEAVAKGLSGLARRLVALGADINLPDGSDGTPLMHSAWTCNLDMATFFLERGARFDAVDKDGETALILAAGFCHDGKMVQLLLDAGAAVDTKCKCGTALTVAAFEGDEEAVRALVKAGADLNATNSEGETALSIAKNRVIGRKEGHDRIHAFLWQVAAEMRFSLKYHDQVTATRETLIEKLVVSLHLNVPERRMLGSDCVSVEEVAAVVKRLFERNGVFPPIAKPWQPGEVVFEGFFLVKRPDADCRAVVEYERDESDQSGHECGDDAQGWGGVHYHFPQMRPIAIWGTWMAGVPAP
jgi:ankyrin repeat protein